MTTYWQFKGLKNQMCSMSMYKCYCLLYLDIIETFLYMTATLTYTAVLALIYIAKKLDPAS